MRRAQLDALFDLSGRVAFVTGGSRGIGRAIAHTYAAAGASVVVASRKAEACDAVVAEIAADGGTALACPLHVGEPEQFDAAVSRAVEQFGALDILVNNAANALAQPMGAMTKAAWDKSFDVNLQGPVLLTQAALPHLSQSEHGGVVINVISVGAFRGAAYLSIYVAAKAALFSVTRSMAKELAPLGIRVNALAPGPFDTDMVRANPEEGQRSMANATLMRRIASTDEIVGPALYLAAPASSYVTGTALVVDGGMTA